MNATLTREETIKFLQNYIDVEALAKLEEAGVLKKHGRGTWYEVLNHKKLPRRIACVPEQMKKEIKNGKERTILRFPTAAQIRQAKAMLAKMRA